MARIGPGGNRRSGSGGSSDPSDSEKDEQRVEVEEEDGNSSSGGGEISSSSQQGNQRSGRDGTNQTRKSVSGTTSPTGDDISSEGAEATGESTSVDRGASTRSSSNQQTEQRIGRDGTNQSRESVSGTTSPTGDDIGSENAESTGRSLSASRARQMSEQRERASGLVSQQVEQRTGVDVEQGEDFTIEQEIIKGRSPTGRERQRANQLQQLGLDERAQTFLNQQTSPRQVNSPSFSQDAEEQIQRAVATQQLENQLEEDTGVDVEEGEDFTVTKTENGFRASPTEKFEREQFSNKLLNREDVDSKDDFEIKEEDGELKAEIKPKRDEEKFVEGALDNADSALDLARVSIEAQSGIDIPGNGAVLTTSDTGSPEQISSTARDVAGVENSTSISESTDSKLGQTDDDIRKGRENLSQEVKDPNQGVDVGSNIGAFFDPRKDNIPYFEKRGVDPNENITSSTVPGASALGPGGAVKGSVRVIASSDDLVKGGGILATAAGAGVASEEIEVPEGNEQRGELERGESVQGKSEFEVTPTEVSELQVSETIDTSELTVPREQRGDTTTIRTTGTVVGEEKSEGDVREITKEDIDGELPEPEQRGPSIREQQRREDLNPPEREFPTGENSVVGRKVTQEPRERVEQSQQSSLSQQNNSTGVEAGRAKSGINSKVGSDQTSLEKTSQFQQQKVGQSQGQNQIDLQLNDFVQRTRTQETNIESPRFESKTIEQGFPRATANFTKSGRNARSRVELPELNPSSFDSDEKKRLDRFERTFEFGVAEPEEILGGDAVDQTISDVDALTEL